MKEARTIKTLSPIHAPGSVDILTFEYEIIFTLHSSLTNLYQCIFEIEGISLNG